MPAVCQNAEEKLAVKACVLKQRKRTDGKGIRGGDRNPVLGLGFPQQNFNGIVGEDNLVLTQKRGKHLCGSSRDCLMQEIRLSF